MKLAIDISQIGYIGTGVARFTAGLVEAICTYDRENEWTFFFSGWNTFLDNNLQEKILKRGFKIIKWRLPPSALSLLWNDLHDFSRVLSSQFSVLSSSDWFITSDWTEPPTRGKKATIVHDLVFLRYPQTLDPVIARVQKKRLELVKKESAVVFADSQSTASDLTDLVGIGRKKIKTIYPGVSVLQPTSSNKEDLKKRFNLHKHFILAVGTIEPRKNIARLIEAFKTLNARDLELVIVGQQGWGEKIEETKNIRYLGFVSEIDLHALYQSCLFFAYPSLWEGFGYPVAEAMTHGIPVATSKSSSMGELGKGRAVLFEAQNVEEITAALAKLYENKNLRGELAKKGKEYSKIFSWKTYYNEMIETLKKQK